MQPGQAFTLAKRVERQMQLQGPQHLHQTQVVIPQQERQAEL